MIRILAIWMLIVWLVFRVSGCGVIRINKLEYFPKGPKTAVFLSDHTFSPKKLGLVDNLTGRIVFEETPLQSNCEKKDRESVHRLNFSSVVQPEGHLREASIAISPSLNVSSGIYKGRTDYILQSIRLERCGYNSILKDTCHTADSIVTDHPINSGRRIDVTGSWHDTTDYLPYSMTSEKAVSQMNTGYRENPAFYKDNYKTKEYREPTGSLIFRKKPDGGNLLDCEQPLIANHTKNDYF